MLLYPRQGDDAAPPAAESVPHRRLGAMTRRALATSYEFLFDSHYYSVAAPVPFSHSTGMQSITTRLTVIIQRLCESRSAVSAGDRVRDAPGGPGPRPQQALDPRPQAEGGLKKCAAIETWNSTAFALRSSFSPPAH